ncbi:hypothetical protein ETB97_008330 [Aspergillus alliaceus]|uniref:Uncharacterized protein n=1 Tax=Petromyces alliaceus TaxID=209559 RepID=A0A8H6E1F5_PETAA|nr:hypothetical protein ETB97_008330 [Aspergillus burnettii]
MSDTEQPELNDSDHTDQESPSDLSGSEMQQKDAPESVKRRQGRPGKASLQNQDAPVSPKGGMPNSFEREILLSSDRHNDQKLENKSGILPAEFAWQFWIPYLSVLILRISV